MVNVIIVAVLAVIVGLIIRGMIIDKKAGKCSCGCDCGACNLCHMDLSQIKVDKGQQ